MENKNILHYVIGAAIGIAVTVLVMCILCCKNDKGMMNKQQHSMPDGTMMHNDDSDMSSMMMDMNAALKGKKGDDFDKAFISEMIVHHEGAVDMAELALTNAKHQEIKDLANEIIKAQTSEITQMKSWQNSWYGVKQ